MSHPASDSRHPRGDDAEMFDLAPVSLWLEDYSALKALFEEWRAAGVSDLRAYLRSDPARVKACSECIRVIKVNRKTLSLFGADDLAHLVSNLGSIFRDDMLTTHIEELAQLWQGRTHFASNTVNYTLAGERLDIQLRGAIVPGPCSGNLRKIPKTTGLPEQEHLHPGIQSIAVLACPEGIEPPTTCLEGRCSIQLSYGQPWRGWSER